MASEAPPSSMEAATDVNAKRRMFLLLLLQGQRDRGTVPADKSSTPTNPRLRRPTASRAGLSGLPRGNADGAGPVPPWGELTARRHSGEVETGGAATVLASSADAVLGSRGVTRQGSPVQCRRCPRNCKWRDRGTRHWPIRRSAGKAPRSTTPSQETSSSPAHRTFSGGGWTES